MFSHLRIGLLNINNCWLHIHVVCSNVTLTGWFGCVDKQCRRQVSALMFIAYMFHFPREENLMRRSNHDIWQTQSNTWVVISFSANFLKQQKKQDGAAIITLHCDIAL